MTAVELDMAINFHTMFFFPYGNLGSRITRAGSPTTLRLSMSRSSAITRTGICPSCRVGTSTAMWPSCTQSTRSARPTASRSAWEHDVGPEFPHSSSSWPRDYRLCREVLERAGCPPNELQRSMWRNGADTYRIPYYEPGTIGAERRRARGIRRRQDIRCEMHGELMCWTRRGRS